MTTSLIAQYTHELDFYQTITMQFQSMLSRVLGNDALHIHSISGRTKDRVSLKNKIRKNGHKYKSLNDITDLCGIRIITYYADEIDQIAAVIRSHFSIDKTNSVDKRQKLDPNEFGYTSLHLIVNLPVNAKGICQSAQAKICKVEIQIRSILQHAWAEIEHDLEYKNPAGTSDEIRRRFSRMAGLLEVADQEFLSLRNTLEPKTAPIVKTAPKRLTAAYVPAKTAAELSATVPVDNTAGLSETSFLKEFPNLGWAAFITLLFFILTALCDFYFGTKITHLALAFSTLLTMG